MKLLGEVHVPHPPSSRAEGRAAHVERWRIALISDTHGLLRPQAEDFLRGAAHIVHAGDIGPEDVVVRLRALAPLTIVRGNNDRAPWAASIRDREHLTTGGLGLLVIHDRAQLDADRLADAVHVVVSGHSHKASIEPAHGRLFINPGSAGPRRFRLPVSVGELVVDYGGVTARLYELELARG